jgi:hypothetical protein
MKNREILKALVQLLHPVLEPMGFRPESAPGGRICAWARPGKPRRFETVWAQLDKWPYDPWIGTRFTVEFQEAGKRSPGAVRGSKRARLAPLLSSAQRRRVIADQNAIIRRLRIPTLAKYSEYAGWPVADKSLYIDIYREARRPLKELRPADDLWLRVLSIEDVHQWSALLADWMPQLLDRFAVLDEDHYRW